MDALLQSQEANCHQILLPQNTNAMMPLLVDDPDHPIQLTKEGLPIEKASPIE